MKLPADQLRALFAGKYGELDEVGWSPKRRFAFGYFLPSDIYEVVVSNHVGEGSRWLDVGGGHSIFPDNPSLALALSAKCASVVAVDPSENVSRNKFAHKTVRSSLEAFASDTLFDLATMRMVVEHVIDPEAFVSALAALIRPGGVAIVFTVSKHSPVTFASRIIPFRLHHPVKSLLWGGEEADTFPAYYRMNTRKRLRELFMTHGFTEEQFLVVDDLSTFGNFKLLNYAELLIWRLTKRLGVAYPEHCFVGVYRRNAGN